MAFAPRMRALLLGTAGGVAPAVVTNGQIVGVGDSIMFGYMGGGHVFMSQLGFPAGVSVANLSVSATTLATNLANAQVDNVAAYYRNDMPCVAVVEGGTNDLSVTALSGVALYDVHRQIVQLLQSQGFYVAISTILPRSDALWSSPKETERNAYNALVRANSVAADIIVDWASDPTIGDGTNTNLTTYYADKLHLTAAGQDIAATIYSAAIAPLLVRAPRALAAVPAISLATPTFGAAKFGNGLTAGSGTIDASIVPIAGMTAPYTMSCWFSTTSVALRVLFGQKNGAATGWYAGLDAAGKVTVAAFNGTAQTATSSASFNDGTLHHLAVVMGTADMKAYVDGALVATLATVPAAINGLLTLGIYGGAFAWLGVIDEFAIFSGVKYSGSFTPPVAALTSSEAGLIACYHLDGDSAGIRGPAWRAMALTSMTFGAAKFSTGRTAGSGAVPTAIVPLTGLPKPFTIECWFSTTAVALKVLFGQTNGAGTSVWYVALDATGKLRVDALNGTDQNALSSASFNDGVLHHLAMVMSTTNMKGYIDGVLVATLGIMPVGMNSQMNLGIHNGSFAWSGVIDEFALFNGARYSANFTPPTGPYVASEPNLIACYHLDGDGTAVIP